MKKVLFPAMLMLAICSSSLLAQHLSFPNHDLRAMASIACPFNPDSTVVWPVGWMIYQTENDQWDGEVDSTRCISMIETSDLHPMVSLTSIDMDKALFIRQSHRGEDGIQLAPDFVYSLTGSINLSGTDTLSMGYTCAGDVCSGMIVVVEIPDESGVGMTRRVHKSVFERHSQGINASTCLVTEYFSENILREVILKVKFATPPEGIGMTMYGIFSEAPFLGEVAGVEELVFTESTFTGEGYQANIENVAHPQNSFIDAPYLFLHEREVYPNVANLTYIEGRPEPPIAEPAELRVSVNPYQGIHFQPYTGIRGALVSPDDTLRHTLTLVNDGGDFCFPFVVELVVSDGAEVEFRSGHVDFQGPNSCIMFRDGGALVVPNNTRFVYGSEGLGALGLDKGGTIQIGKQSELVLNNTVVLSNFKTGADRQVYVELNPGSRLTFGQNAHLIRKGHVQTGQMKLNIYMNGGVLDDSHLSLAERQLIHRIYPDEEANDNDWVKILGNPVEGPLKLAVSSIAQNLPASWSVYDMSGRRLADGQFPVDEKQHFQEILLPQVTAGMYILEMELGGERISKRFVKVH